MTQFLRLNGVPDLRSNRLYALLDQANPTPTLAGPFFELSGIAEGPSAHRRRICQAYGRGIDLASPQIAK
jgi:hypothetical protein